MAHQNTLLLVERGGRIKMRGGRSRPEAAQLETHILDHIAQLFEAKGAEYDEIFLERDRVTFTLMRSDDGEEAFLATVTPMAGMLIPSAGRLSRTKRQIAAYAAAGCTIEEIANELERSPHTIKTHLKAIYEELGIGSRAELSALVNSAYTNLVL